jgi:hypothetical protein
MKNIQPQSEPTLKFNSKNNVINDSACIINLECPIIGALIHSDTLNLTTYNDYISDSLELSKMVSKVIDTNNDRIVLLKLPSTSNINNIDSLLPNSLTKFGQISSDNCTLPGIFVSDSANPLDFIIGDHESIQIVNVNADSPQNTLNNIQNQGSLIVFDFANIGSVNKYSNSSELNNAIKKAGGEMIGTIFLPYTLLLKQLLKDSNGKLTGEVEFMFEYATFKKIDSGINITYYRKAENKATESNTYLLRDNLKSENCFRYMKNYGGSYVITNPVGRLVTNINMI